MRSATIFSKEDLDIHPLAAGGGAEQDVKRGGCPLIRVQKFRTGAYPFVYSGLTLLLQSGGNLFLTPTPNKPQTPWDPDTQAVFVIPNDSNVRVQFARGVDYVVNPGEALAKAQLPSPADPFQ